MSTFQLGVIEGFYGRDWPDSDRLQLLPWMRAHNYQSYIFAPKSEHFLRAQWDQKLPDGTVQRLQGIQAAAESASLAWGVGFSPLGAVHCFDQAAQRKMSSKLQQLADFNMDILAILFDDMHCATQELAARQCEIVEFIQHRMPTQQIIMCPTYYSYDPILEKVFGAMPERYWQQLGDGLASNVDVFWTGNKVCSESVQVCDLTSIGEALRRPVTLWDNYPVNDGARASKFLHIDSFSARDQHLPTQVRGHFCNPMNQCELSKVALASLPMLYKLQDNYDASAAFNQFCLQEFGASMGERLIEDRLVFTEQGLDAIAAPHKRALIEKYEDISHPAAREVSEWLKDGYAFDPACLTETGA